MAKLTVYKYVRTPEGWRYSKAAFHPNGKIKPNIVLVKGLENKYLEGSYFTLSAGKWIALGDDALDTQRKVAAMTVQ